MSREVVVVGGVRSAIGTYGGSLKDTPSTELAALLTMCVGGGRGIAATFERCRVSGPYRHESQHA